MSNKFSCKKQPLYWRLMSTV